MVHKVCATRQYLDVYTTYIAAHPFLVNTSLARRYDGSLSRTALPAGTLPMCAVV
jgi:hypothetical protein